MLIDHQDPKPTPLAERYKFFQMQQGQLKVADWRAKLAYTASLCNFTAENRPVALRDQFIFGLADEKTRVILMTEEDITLDNAYKKALAREHALEDNKLMATKQVNSLQKSAHSSKMTQDSGKSTKQGGGSKGFKSANGAAVTPGNQHKKGVTCDRCKLQNRVTALHAKQNVLIVIILAIVDKLVENHPKFIV